MRRDAVMAELETIRRKHGGVLYPRDVVAFARNPKTALHAKFDWNDTEAAKKWRLEQARQVIRLHVTVISQKSGPVRAFVSLTSDRQIGGGYRALVDVLDNAQQMDRLVADALAELDVIRLRYQKLRALGPIWDAMSKVAREIDQVGKNAA